MSALYDQDADYSIVDYGEDEDTGEHWLGLNHADATEASLNDLDGPQP